MKGHEHLARPKPTLTDAYTHQWIRVDGATETAIPGATRGLSLPFIPSCLPTTARLSGTDIILSQWIL